MAMRATLTPESSSEADLPPRQGPYQAGERGVARIQDGHYLLGDEDEVLAEPVVYYIPDEPEKSLRFIPGQYPVPKATAGRIIAHTKYQEDFIRRVLRGNADRYRGDDMPTEKCCKHGYHQFCTRNRDAWDDHQERFA